MLWTLFLFALYLQPSAFQVIFQRRTEISYEIAGIFNKNAVEQYKAFRESTAKASVEDRRLNGTIIYPAKTDSFSVWKELCHENNQAMRPVAILGPQNAISDRMVRDQCALAQIPHLQAAWQPFDPDADVAEEEIEGEKEEEQETENAGETAEEQPESEAAEDNQEETEEVEKKYKNISINFYPDSNEIALAFAQLLKFYKWTNFAVLFEDDYGLLRVQKILANYTSNFPVFVRRLYPDSNIDENYRTLKELKNSTESRIIIDCHVDNIPKYMDISEKLGLIDYYKHFVFLSLDTGAHAEQLLKYKSNITWMSLAEYDKLNSAQHFLAPRVGDWTTNNELRSVITFNLESLLMADMANHVIQSIQELEMAQKQTILPHPEDHVCNSESPWEFGAALQHHILNAKTKGVTGPIEFDAESGKRVGYSLYVNEKFGKNCTTIAHWDSSTPDTIIDDRRGDIESNIQSLNMHFIIISRIAEPYFILKEPCKEGDENCTDTGEQYEGFSVDLVTEIFKQLKKQNYSFEFRVPKKDITYGHYDPLSKKWDGLIGELLEKKADLAVCDLTITEERKKVVDFSVPFMSLGIGILYTKIEPPEPAMFAFLNPYEFEVWMYIATAYCVVSIVLFLCARISPPDWENPQPCDKDPEELENIWNFKNCAWLTMGSIMTQGCDILPKAFGSRWVCSMWWFFAVIVCQTYIAQLSAAMTSAMEDDAINSVEDLAKQTKVRYGAIEGGTTYDFFKNSNDKTYQTIHKYMNASKAVLVSNNDEGVKRVLAGHNKYAFFMESTTIDYKRKRNCKLRKVGNLLDSKDYGIAMPANSPFRKDINEALLTLKEMTRIEAIKDKWWNEKLGAKSDCNENVDTDDIEGDLEMQHLYGAFVVLIGGLVFSLFITAAEFFDEVRNIVVREQMTHKEAFIKELKASLNFLQLQKPVQRNPSRAQSVVSTKSQLEDKQARRAMALESFLDLEKMG